MIAPSEATTKPGLLVMRTTMNQPNRPAIQARLSSASFIAGIPDSSPKLLGQKRPRDGGTSSGTSDGPVKHRAMPRNPADLVSKEIMVVNGDSAADDDSSLTFLKPTDEMVAAYRMEVVTALRTEKVEELKKLHEAGLELQCCNRFGESLLHMACRRSLTDVVKFLVREAKVSLLVKDDFGRTALHFALWTPQPNFELVEFIVEEVPALLSVKDVRGHLPLQYARKEDWNAWCEFFEARRHILLRRKESASPVSALPDAPVE
jgi:Ankyrin repeats (3 copies)